jgi:hypothetical protein
MRKVYPQTASTAATSGLLVLSGAPDLMPAMTCTHDGFHSGQGRYDSGAGRLRYVMVCEECGQEVAEVDQEPYRPDFDPNGNAAFRNAA